MKNNQKVIASVIFGVVILALAGVAGYSAWSKKLSKENTNESLSTQADISDSKTYQNISENYSIKYPPAWYLDSYDPKFITITNYDSSVGGTDASLGAEQIQVRIITYITDSKKETLKSWVDKINLVDRKDILVNGTKAIRGRVMYTGEEESGYYAKGQLSGEYILFIANGKKYQIIYEPFGSKLASTFENILSTFKFTNQAINNGATIPKDWKTYRDEAGFFEFSYPQYAHITTGTNYGISDTRVTLKEDLTVTFDIVTSPDVGLCNDNPYKLLAERRGDQWKVVEEKVNKYGNEYSRLSVKDISADYRNLEEERFFIIKNNICYVIVNSILVDPDTIDPQINVNLEQIFSTLKFTK